MMETKTKENKTNVLYKSLIICHELRYIPDLTLRNGESKTRSKTLKHV